MDKMDIAADLTGRILRVGSGALAFGIWMHNQWASVFMFCLLLTLEQ